MVVRVAAMGFADARIVGRLLRARSEIEGASTASMSFRFFRDWVGLVIVAIVAIAFAVSILRGWSGANHLVCLVVSSARRWAAMGSQLYRSMA
jgi:hypothetical protein